MDVTMVSLQRASNNEKEHVGRLLRGLCGGIVQPSQRRGRPRLALADVVHAAATKTYVGMSAAARRQMFARARKRASSHMHHATMQCSRTSNEPT
jgi:hypothetical protein